MTARDWLTITPAQVETYLEGLGLVLAGDIGKRYFLEDGSAHVENDQQQAVRLAKPARAALEDIQADGMASNWISAASRAALRRDPVDAANDATVLAAMLNAHCRELLGKPLELTSPAEVTLPTPLANLLRELCDRWSGHVGDLTVPVNVVALAEWFVPWLNATHTVLDQHPDTKQAIYATRGTGPAVPEPADPTAVNIAVRPGEKVPS